MDKSIYFAARESRTEELSRELPETEVVGSSLPEEFLQVRSECLRDGIASSRRARSSIPSPLAGTNRMRERQNIHVNGLCVWELPERILEFTVHPGRSV